MTFMRREPNEKPGEGVTATAPLSWLTVEVALYGLIFLSGLVARLAALGRWPLLDTELNTALAAWRTLKGSDWRPAQYVPLLYDADLLFFGLTRATGEAARLLPALVGAGLVVVPYFVRDLLGRRGALVAALLLAFSPTWLFVSRTADGAILTAAASALLLLSVYRYGRNKEPRYLQLGAVTLALGLTSGAGCYTTLVSALAFGFIWWLVNRRDKERITSLFARLSAAAKQVNPWLLVGVFTFFASGFIINLGGIGVSIGLAGRWVAGLAPDSSGLPWFYFPRALGIYEFLTIALALVGAVSGLRRRSTLDAFLITWVLLVLALGTLLGHRGPIWLADALLPLLILAARGFERTWDRLAGGMAWSDASAALIGFALLTSGFVELAVYTHSGQVQSLHYALAAWGVSIISWAALALFSEWVGALRIGAILLVLFMGIATVRTSTAVAYQTGRDPREMLVHRPASAQLTDFEAFVATFTSRQVGDPSELDIVYEEGLGPQLMWLLRDYPKARAVAAVEENPEAKAAVTLCRPLEKGPGGYVGQRFRLDEAWPEQKLSIRERLRWFFYRDSVGAEETTEIEVWVQAPEGK